MFLQIILGTIPRSLRAGVALVVMLFALSQAFFDFQVLVVPGTSKFKLVEGIFWLIVGIAATITFYYFQAADGAGPKKYIEVDTLSKAYESQRKEKELRSKKADPAFPDLDTADSRKAEHDSK